MPIYEYRCGSCGLELEKLQKLSEPALKDCPSCQQPSLVKQVSASSFRLKGSGWYETDFKNSGKKKDGGNAQEKTQNAAGDAGQDASGAAAANSGG